MKQFKKKYISVIPLLESMNYTHKDKKPNEHVEQIMLISYGIFDLLKVLVRSR